MVRMLHILSICFIVLAGCVVYLWLTERNRRDPRVEAILNGSTVVQQLPDAAAGRPTGGEQVTPLVDAAQGFAVSLNSTPTPAVMQATKQTSVQPTDSKPSEPRLTARPVFSAVGFKLVATSYYEGRPDKSMALLSEPGNGDVGRWVREGTQVGHFTVHEIRQGVVVLRDGNNTRELAVERATLQRNLVKEVRPGNSQANAAIRDSNDQN
jgi:hypothetical protein